MGVKLVSCDAHMFTPAARFCFYLSRELALFLGCSVPLSRVSLPFCHTPLCPSCVSRWCGQAGVPLERPFLSVHLASPWLALKSTKYKFRELEHIPQWDAQLCCCKRPDSELQSKTKVLRSLAVYLGPLTASLC